MKTYKQFISESINIAGDFNGTLIVGNPDSSEHPVKESYTADILWKGSLYRLELVSESLPCAKKLAEDLQEDYPGALVQYIYPSSKSKVEVKASQRYHPAKLDWI